MPASLCGPYSNFLTLLWGQFDSPCFAAFQSANLAARHGCWILTCVWVFERRPVHLLTDCLLDHVAGGHEEISVLA